MLDDIREEMKKMREIERRVKDERIESEQVVEEMRKEIERMKEERNG
jgi:uncharacterized protein YukE